MSAIEPNETVENHDLKSPTQPGSSDVPPPPETIIQPSSGWQAFNLSDLWHYRELVFFLAWRDIKVRYKQTILGAAWAILQPLLFMLVFTVVLSRMAEIPVGDTPYPLFSYCGLVLWTFFAGAVTNASNSVVDSERLVTKIYFPRLAIPLAAAGAASLDFLVASSFLIVMMVYYGVVPTLALLLAPLMVLMAALTALGIGALLAALNVAYRDFRHVVPFLVQLWMFATPTLFFDSGPPRTVLAMLLNLNPMNGITTFFRSCVLGTPLPWAPLGISAAVSLSMIVVGVVYFRRVEDSFADII